jgi:flagellar motor component MotA
MNGSAIIGIILATLMVVVGIALHSPLTWLIEPVSMLMVIVGLPYLLLLTYSAKSLSEYGLGGLVRMLWPDKGNPWRPDEHLLAARIANSASILAILMGTVGTLIGVVQMLQALDDPTKIGPAMAVALITSLYALGIYALLCHPLAQHHQAAAVAAGASISAARDADPPLRHVVVITALIGLSVGCTFMTMLVAMSSFS